MTPWQHLVDTGKWCQAHPEVLIGLAMALPVLMIVVQLVARRHANSADTHGSARWSTYREVCRSGLSRTHGVVVGTWHGQVFYDDGDTHLILCGPTRSTKGVCHIQPTLRVWGQGWKREKPREQGGCALILDPKDGENYHATCEVRRQYGRVEAFRPYGRPWACINVGDTIRIGQICEVSDARAIATSLTAPYKMVHENATSLHFRDLGRMVIQAGLLHLAYTQPSVSLPALWMFLTQYYEDLPACLKAMHQTRHTPFGTHPAIASLVKVVRNIASERELSGVWTTAIRPLEIYNDPMVAASTLTSTVTLTDLQLGSDPLSLYLLAPSPRALEDLYPVYRVIVDIAMVRLMDRPVKTPAHRLLFCAEELPAHGYMHSINTGAGDMAGYGIKGFYVIQDLDQFEQVYGEKNTIWGNTETKLFHAPNNERTAERISKYLLGSATVAHPVQSRQDGLLAPGSVSYGHVARPLLTPDEVMGFDPSQVLVRRTGAKPMRLEKWGYDPRYREAA